MTDDDLHDQFGDEIAGALRLDQPEGAGSTADDIRRGARRLRTRRRIAAAVVAVAVVATTVGVVGSRNQGPHRVNVVTGPSSSIAPSTTAAEPTTTIPAVAGDSGILQQFTPLSATTWWAVVQDNLQPEEWVVRTTDSGGHWRNVSPIPGAASQTFFLNADTAWVAGDAGLHPGQTIKPLYRTLDGGQSWTRVGAVPSQCALQFVDELDGWCQSVGAAAGSESIDLWRTTNGGSKWVLVSRTGIPGNGQPGTPDAVPFGCDKSVTFTSAEVGWAPFSCSGGVAPVYRSTDAGSTWHLVPGVPLPPHSKLDSGSAFTRPVARGSQVALIATVFGTPFVTAIDTSADGGATWRTASIPDPTKQWDIDLVDPTHWRMTDGKDLVATDDAGAHWRTMTAPPTTTDPTGAPLDLKFLTPALGWAIPGPNGGRIWWTRDGGNSWQPVSIVAGPYQLGTAVR